MRNLILIFLMVCTLQCIDKDKDRFEFIDKLINDPDNFEKIIKGSKYFDERVQLTSSKEYYIEMEKYIKTYFYQEKYQVLLDTIYYLKKHTKKNERIKILENLIHIKRRKASLFFTFVYVKDKWNILNIDDTSPIIKSIDGMY